MQEFDLALLGMSDELGWLLAALVAFGVSLLMTPVIVRVAHLKQLTAQPDDRSSHVSATPTLGGVALFGAIVIAMCTWGGEAEKGLNFLIAAMTILFFTGLKDDILIIAPNKKLLLQLVAFSFVVFGADVRIPGLFGIFGIQELNYWVSALFTLFVLIALTNAYNLIDGIDGLAAVTGIIISLSFAYFFVQYEAHTLAMIAFVCAGALLGFLPYNFSEKSKIFMGDTGALLIGFILSLLAIRFVQISHPGIDMTRPETFNAPVIAIGIMILPLMDTLHVFLFRILNGKSPFKADRNHIHHRLLDLNLKHWQATMVLSAYNLVLILITFYFRKTSGVHTYLLLILGIATFLFTIPFMINRAKEKAQDGIKDLRLHRNDEMGKVS